MSGKICIVFTTVNEEEKAKTLSKALVENKLAACVSISQVNSQYYWKGKIEEEKEYSLMIKTSIEKREALVKWLKENHPYETPEIIVVDAEAYDDYYSWLQGYLSGGD